MPSAGTTAYLASSSTCSVPAPVRTALADDDMARKGRDPPPTRCSGASSQASNRKIPRLVQATNSASFDRRMMMENLPLSLKTGSMRWFLTTSPSSLLSGRPLQKTQYQTSFGVCGRRRWVDRVSGGFWNISTPSSWATWRPSTLSTSASDNMIPFSFTGSRHVETYSDFDHLYLILHGTELDNLLGVYFKPQKRNQEAVDGFLKRIILIQITVAKSHEIKAAGIIALYDAVPEDFNIKRDGVDQVSIFVTPTPDYIRRQQSVFPSYKWVKPIMKEWKSWTYLVEV